MIGTETLVVIACLAGNSNGCETSARAYYQNSPLSQYVETISKENSTLAQGFTVVAAIYKRQATFGIGYNFETNIDFSQGTGVPYIKWSYGF